MSPRTERSLSLNSAEGLDVYTPQLESYKVPVHFGSLGICTCTIHCTYCMDETL